MADGETVGRKRKSSSGSARQEEKKSARAKNADNAMDAIAEEDGLPAKYHLVLRDLRDDTDDCSVKISKTYSSQFLHVSPDKLTVTGNKGYRLARATHAAPEYGTWFFEITVKLNQGHVRVGWAPGYADKDLPCGCEDCSYSYRDIEGTKFNAARPQSYGDSYSTGDVIGCWLRLPPRPAVAAKALGDTDDEASSSELSGVSNGGKGLKVRYIKGTNSAFFLVPEQERKRVDGAQIRFTKNGIDQGIAHNEIWAAHYHPAVSLYKNAQVTFNFGPQFKFPPSATMAGARPISDLSELLRPPNPAVSADEPTATAQSTHETMLAAAVQTNMVSAAAVMGSSADVPVTLSAVLTREECTPGKSQPAAGATSATLQTNASSFASTSPIPEEQIKNEIQSSATHAKIEEHVEGSTAVSGEENLTKVAAEPSSAQHQTSSTVTTDTVAYRAAPT